MSTLDHVPGWARDLLRDERVAHLGLLDAEGRPRVLPVTFALAGGCLVSAIDHKPKRDASREPARVRFLRSRPEAALTVDHYSDDWDELAWVQALGPVEVLEAEAAPEAIDALLAKYPPYVQQPPGGPVLRLRPKRFLCWRAR